MEISFFLSMLGFLWVAAITPGPNNMLLTTSGANFGFVRSLLLVIGRLLHSRRSWYTFNIAMGLLTAACVLLIWR